ncbi:hypothetical protein RUM44_000323 [Polyplax serrata]|uniref:Uncharacterized protein n=1 Tax=Polyplax serrata TaxID=468196 RepID=A0ABR1B555_POLSC
MSESQLPGLEQQQVKHLIEEEWPKKKPSKRQRETKPLRHNICVKRRKKRWENNNNNNNINNKEEKNNNNNVVHSECGAQKGRPLQWCHFLKGLDTKTTTARWKHREARDSLDPVREKKQANRSCLPPLRHCQLMPGTTRLVKSTKIGFSQRMRSEKDENWNRREDGKGADDGDDEVEDEEELSRSRSRIIRIDWMMKGHFGISQERLH